MKPLLAGKFEEAKVAKKLPLFGQPKYDGIRLFNRDGVAYTRSLKPARSEQVQSRFSHGKGWMNGLDGEVICGDPTAKNCYSITDSSVMSFNKPHDDMRYYCFDRWDDPSPFWERLAGLEKEQEKWPDWCRLAPTVELKTMEEVWDFYTGLAEQGHEGAILRNPHSYYKYGRGTPVQCECIKMKENGWQDTECRILDFYEQMENTNEATLDNLGNTQRSGHKENLIGKRTLGALLLRGKFEDGSEFECRCGSGMDDALRQAVWNNPAQYKEKIVKIKYFTIGIKDKPRFPIFLGFRDPSDMDAEQLEMF